MAITGALAAAARVFDPDPEAILALDFAGVRTGGRQFYKREGIIVPRFEMLRGAASVGHAGFGRTQVNGAYPVFAPDAPLIGDGGVLIPEGRECLWPDNDGLPPENTWPTAVTATRAAGTISSHIADAVPVLFTTTGVNSRLQRNIGIPNDSLVRTFTVWVERKANTYFVQTGAVNGMGVSASVTFDGETGAISGSSSGATVIADGDYWRVDVPLTNNSSGNTLIYGFVQLTGGAGLTANLLCPMITVGPSILGPPIVTTGLPATRPACGIGVPQPTDLAHGTVLLEGLWPVWGGASTEGVFLEPGVGGSPSGFTLQTSALRRRPRVLFRSGAARMDAAGGADIQPGALFRMALSWGSGAPVASFNGVSLISSNTPAQADFDPSHLLSVGARGVGAGGFFANSSGLRSIRWLAGQIGQARLDAVTAL